MKKTIISTDERWKLVIESSDPKFKFLPDPTIAIFKNDVASADVLHIDVEGLISLHKAIGEFIEAKEKINDTREISGHEYNENCGHCRGNGSAAGGDGGKS